MRLASVAFFALGLTLGPGSVGWLCPRAMAAETARIPLAGEWRFQLDRGDAGVTERWFERPLEQRLKLPGALQNQGFGDDITVDTKWTGEVGVDAWLKGPQYAKYRGPGNIKVPFFLQPEKHYVGAAWYQRVVDVPAAWHGKRVVLRLERAHWETRVWLDSREIGTNTSLSTPHSYDLGTGLEPGKHTLTVRVDNRMIVNVGPWAHSVTDHTQGNWNGMIGGLELLATSPVWIEEAQVYPNVASKSVLVKVRIGNASGKAGHGTLTIGLRSKPVDWDDKGGTAEVEVPLGKDAKTWDEFDPTLQTLLIRLTGAQADDRRTVTFGLREIGAEGKEFVLNGRKTLFRGTLECCIFPLTGYPPTDVQSWKRVIRACKAYGLNLIRFHSWCPPEAAFVAADELGFYFQVVRCLVQPWREQGPGSVALRGERAHREGLRQPPFVRAAHARQRAAWQGPRYVSGRVGQLLEATRLAPPGHQRLGLPATPRESVPRLCGGTRAAWLAGQGLPQRRAGADGARHRA